MAWIFSLSLTGSRVVVFEAVVEPKTAIPSGLGDGAIGGQAVDRV